MNTMHTVWYRILIAAWVAVFCLSTGTPMGASADQVIPAAPTDLYSLDLELDGTDDYASAPDSTSLDVGTGSTDDFTLETFFYVPDLANTTNDTLFWKNGAYGLYILYYTAQADRFIFRLYTDPVNYVYIYYNVELTTGWHHVAAVFDNEYNASQDLIALYLDGSLAASNTAAEWTPGIPNSSSALNVGGYLGINPAQGWMEETRISNTVRYSGSTYTIPVAAFTSDGNTNALWHFDDGWGATTFVDSSSNGNTLTGVNGAKVGNPSGTPPAPGAFGKSAPANGAANQSTSPTLSWGTSSGATSYEYCYDTSNNSTCNNTWVSTGSNTSIGLSGLSPNTTYYWQVHAINTGGTTEADGGVWWSFATSSSAPADFSKSAPANGLLNRPLSLSLTWNSSSGASSYEYCYDTSNDSACGGSWISTGTGTSVGISSLSYDTTYYWQVRAVNTSGTTYANSGTWWNFTTIPVPPGAFSKIAPVNGAVGQSLNPLLSWGTSSGVFYYEYCYDTNNNSACDGSWNSTSSTFTSISGLSALTTYYWQVRAVNAGGATDANSGTWWSFTTMAAETAQPGPTYTVNSTAQASDGVCGVSHCTLWEAINAANTDGVLSTIELQTGATYTLAFPVDSSYGDSGLPQVYQDVAIHGNNATIQRDPALACSLNESHEPGEFRILYITANAVTISDITMKNGCADGIYPETHDSTMGGAININNGSINLINVILSNNYAIQGGAIYTDDAGVSLDNTTITANTADSGGGIFQWGGTVSLTDSVVDGNSAIQGGGGVYVLTGAFSATHSTISNNTTPTWGGGVFTDWGGVTLTDSTVSGNFADTLGGGGILVQAAGGSLSLIRTTVSNNKTNAGGGGIGVAQTGTVTIMDSSVTSNSATQGGGGLLSGGTVTISGSLFANNTTPSQGGALALSNNLVTITNTTISGNSAGWIGGGISNGSNTTINISYSTITGNIADTKHNGLGFGGGIRNYLGTVNLKSSILAGNSDWNGLAPDCGGELVSQDYNLIQSLTGCTVAPSLHDITGLDPLLNPLLENGGPTPTHALQLNSPVMDKIPGSVNGCGTTYTSDQRGNPRPVDGNNDGSIYCDIGAYEFNPWSIPSAFEKTSPANAVTYQPASLVLSWNPSADTISYEVCYDTTNDGYCFLWTNVGTATNTTVSGLLPSTKYYWQVRANNMGGVTSANGGTWWSFTTMASASFFADIPADYWARSFIERLYAAGITGGCSTNPLMYCPEVSVNRAQMAVFLLRGEHGNSYNPPTATGMVFGDVPANYWAAAWIEQLYAEGITGGCGSGNYCPETPVTRDQMAVFLLRAEHGNGYAPPDAVGAFADVPTNHWAAAWIEQLAAEGITGGCGGGNYCPATVVNRAQMAVFLVRTFGLP